MSDELKIDIQVDANTEPAETKVDNLIEEFKKKNPVIFDESMTDISKQFTITKNGIEFFYDQTGIDEETFYNTAITEQEGIKLSKSSQNSIIQKISNLIVNRDENIKDDKTVFVIKIC